MRERARLCPPNTRSSSATCGIAAGASCANPYSYPAIRPFPSAVPAVLKNREIGQRGLESITSGPLEHHAIPYHTIPYNAMQCHTTPLLLLLTASDNVWVYCRPSIACKVLMGTGLEVACIVLDPKCCQRKSCCHLCCSSNNNSISPHSVVWRPNSKIGKVALSGTALGTHSRSWF